MLALLLLAATTVTGCGEFNATGGILAPLILQLSGTEQTTTQNTPAGITISQSNGSTAVMEGGQTDSYSLVLDSAPEAAVTITLTPDAQLMVNGSSSSIELTFTASQWDSPQSVMVEAVDDGAIEGDHYGAIIQSIQSSDQDYSSLSISDLGVAITDNDGNLLPTVESVFPSDGTTNVATNSSITVTFSEAMDPATITTNTGGGCAGTTFQVSSDDFSSCVAMTGAPSSISGDKTFAVTPASSLPTATTFKIRIIGGSGGAADTEAGELAADYTTPTGFTTGSGGDTTAPTVVSTLPADGSNNQVRNTVLAIQFSESMNFATLTSTTSGTSCSGAIQLSADNFSSCMAMDSSAVSSNEGRIATLEPASNLASSTTYKLKITTAAKDLAGNSLDAPTTVSFTTGSTTDTTPPTATLSPSDGSVGVSRYTEPVISFDDDMNPSTITTNVGTTSCNGTVQLTTATEDFASCIPMNAAPSVQTTYSIFRITPANQLEPGTEYKLRVITSVSDKANNGLTSTTVAFHTAPLRMFLSSSTTKGDFADGGAYNGDPVGFADNACNSGTVPDGNSTYKAMFIWTGTGSNRDTSTDWVFEPNTYYYRTDQSASPSLGTQIFTTNASGTSSGAATNSPLATAASYWTGIDGATWTEDTGNSCDNWTNPNNPGDGFKGAAGSGDQTNATAIGTDNPCHNARGFLCVEQL